MELRTEKEIRPAIGAAVSRHSALIRAELPDAGIEHIGSTAVEGALTKGDLDLLVQVPASGFDAAVEKLGGLYAIHQPENWTTRFASFKEVPEDELPVGVQLVVAGGTDDRLFRAWRDRLATEPALLARYNELKRAHVQSEPAAYIDAKAALIEAEIGGEIGAPADARAP